MLNFAIARVKFYRENYKYSIKKKKKEKKATRMKPAEIRMQKRKKNSLMEYISSQPGTFNFFLHKLFKIHVVLLRYITIKTEHLLIFQRKLFKHLLTII